METSTPAPKKANPTSREGPASISVSPICTAATDVKSYPQRERKPKRLGDDYEDGINMNREHKKLGSASKKRKKTSPESANTDETVAKSKSLEDSFCNSISHLKSGSESVSSFQPSNLEALKYVDKDKTKDLSESLIIDSSDDSEYTFENREQYLELKKEVERVRTTKRLALEVKQGVGSKNKSSNNDRTNGAHSHVGIAESGIGTTRETKLLACEDIAQSENQQLDTSISTDSSRRKGRRSVKSVNYAELDKGVDLSEMDKSKENQTVNTSKKKSRGGRPSKKDLLLTQLKDKYEDVYLGNVEDNDTKFNESSKKELDNENEKVIEMPKKRVRKSDCKDLSVSDVLSDDSNVTIETSLDAESFLSKTVQEKGLIEEPVQKKKRRRKPKRQEQHEESINEGESLLNNTTNGIQEAFEKTDKPVQERKRGRKPKNQESLEASINEGESFLNNTMNGIQEELEKTDEPLPKRKRGKKQIKDAVMPEVNACSNQPLSADGTAGVAGEVVSKRGRKRKAVDYSSLADEGLEDPEHNKSKNDEESQDQEKEKSQRSGGQQLICKHCAFESTSVAMRSHYAIHHHLAWSKENEAGSCESREDIRQILKYRKSLSCPKCDKQINFDFYYWQHLEWCGRENETYICEHCQKGNLKVKWQALHIKTCPGLVMKNPAPTNPVATAEDSNHSDDTPTAGGRKKRKAYKKAMTIVQNISKEMGTEGDSDDGSNRKDPDVKLDSDFEGDEDDEIDDVDENISNDEDGAADDDDDSEDVNDLQGIDTSVNRLGMKRGIPYDWQYHMMFYDKTLKLQKSLHRNVMFPEWLPRIDSFKSLIDSEAEPYLPKAKASLQTLSDTGPKRVNLLEGCVIEGYPTLNTGLDVWRLAWCPQPPDSGGEQVLAVVGKLSRDHTLGARNQYVGPGAVQIWGTGVTSNISSTTLHPPRLLFNLAHDSGHVTGMAWCPTGAYQSVCGGAHQVTECYRRLGLLALALTDGTVCIFSIPSLDAPGEGEVRTLKVEPSVTLLAHREPERRGLTCTCLDWGPVMMPDRILTGYSDGSVRLFHLATASPLQWLRTDHPRQLLPCSTYQFHSSPVRALRWCGTEEHKVASTADKFDTIFRDLENPCFPQSDVDSVFMATSMASAYFYNGIFIASDDNYGLNTNRARYLKCRTLMYQGTPLKRTDESYSYYLSNQHCAIWDISVSNWLNFGIMCDDLGRVMGIPMRDLLKMPVDTKTYRQRQQLVSTEKKYSKHLPESVSKLNSTHSAPDQSNSDSLGTCVETNQSELSKQSTEQRSKSDPKKRTRNKVQCTEISITDKQDLLVFTDHNQIRKQAVPDEPSTDRNQRFEALSDVALRACQFNPNHQQCCWLAYGGVHGIVRLSNLIHLLPTHSQKTIRDNNVTNT